MSGLPPQTTIFNFEAVLDHIRATTDRIASDYVSIPRFNELLIELGKQTTLFAGNAQAIRALSDNISNFTSLLEALIEGLNGVATLQLQQQELALLQEIVPHPAEHGDFNPETAVITG